MPELELSAVCDPVPENAAHLAQTLGVAVKTLEETLADPELDAVLITATDSGARGADSKGSRSRQTHLRRKTAERDVS